MLHILLCILFDSFYYIFIIAICFLFYFLRNSWTNYQQNNPICFLSSNSVTERKKKKAQHKHVFPDTGDTVHPLNGCSKMMHKRAPSKNTTATGFLSAPQQGTSSMQFPTRIVLDSNSAEPAPQKLSTSNEEIKGHPQTKMKFKTFIYNVRSFSLSVKVLNRSLTCSTILLVSVSLPLSSSGPFPSK